MRPVDPRLLRHARSSRRFLAWSIAIGAATAVVVVVQARLLSGVIVDVTSAGAHWPQVAAPVGLLGLVFGLRALLGWAAESAAFGSAATAKQELRAAATGAVLRGGSYGPATGQTGEVASLLARGIDGLDAYYARYLPQLVLAVFVPLVILGTVLGADLVSTVILAVTIPLIPLFMALIGLYTQSRVDRQWQVLGRLSGHFLDIVSGLPTLKAFGRAKAQERAIRAIGEEYRASTMGVLRVSFLSSLVLELLATLSVALVAVSVGLRLAEGQIDYRIALFVLVLAPEAYLPLRMVGQQFHAAAEGMGAAERIFALIEAAPPQDASAGPTLAPIAELGATGVRVDFGGHQALAPLTFTARAGEITAIAGPSGAGKSTLLAVLLGLLAPTSGSVWMRAGRVVEQGELSREAWLARIGWVPQQAHLISSSLRPRAAVREVVSLGAPLASEAQMWDSLRLAGVAEELDGDDEGLDRLVNADGSGLSAGQAQRLALARALLTEPQVLILDEPTAALDAASEAAVLDALRQAAARGVLVLVVAHRPAVLAMADQIVRLPGGAQ